MIGMRTKNEVRNINTLYIDSNLIASHVADRVQRSALNPTVYQDSNMYI